VSSAQRPIRVAVVGCGEIAQIMHLPYLAELPDFEISGICDLSPSVLERVGDRYSVRERSTDHREIVDGADVVAVLTHEHAPIAEYAAQRRKHIFVEKPLGFSLEECDRILDAVRDGGVKLMIGYMRRFDPGYLYAVEQAGDPARIQFVRAHDFGGSFAVHPELYTLHRPHDVPAEAKEELERKITETMLGALGPGYEQLVDAYYDLLMSGTHDLAILRGLLGRPQAVLHSEPLGTRGLLSVLGYGGGRVGMLEALLIESHAWWDQHLVVYTDERVLTVEFPNPYLRNVATTVEVQANTGAAGARTTVHVSHDTSFRREWQHLAACIRDDRPPLTNGEDARADVELALAIVQAVRRRDD
jgi:predicted dehydrogenase